MVTKRKHLIRNARKLYGENGGFSVGPANLPDGTFKRKVDKIKKNLIHKAKVKRDFAKIKARHDLENKPNVQGGEDVEEDEQQPASLDPHPDRQILMGKSSPSPEPSVEPSQRKRHKRPRQDPFSKEETAAQRRKEDAERRQKERGEAEQQRHEKIQERERMQKAIRKARTPGRDGRRKLGRESELLLEKVKKVMASDGG